MNSSFIESLYLYTSKRVIILKNIIPLLIICMIYFRYAPSINLHDEKLNNELIKEICGDDNYNIISESDVSASLKKLAGYRYEPEVLSVFTDKSKFYIKKIYIFWKDNSQTIFLPADYVGIKNGRIYLEDELVFASLPSDLFSITNRFVIQKSVYLNLLIASVLFIPFLLFSIPFSWNRKVLKQMNSYKYYKSLLVYDVFWGKILFSIIITLSTFMLLIAATGEDILEVKVQNVLAMNPFIESAFFLAVSILVLNLIWELKDVQKSIHNIIYFLLPLSKTNNNFRDDTSFNVEHQQMLKEISELTRLNENQVDILLMRMGFVVQRVYNEKSFSEKILTIPKNFEIISKLRLLSTLGYINIQNNQIDLTLLGKEKAELPTILFTHTIPAVFEYEISRAYFAFLKGDNEESIKICSANILEPFLKWAIKRIETNNEILDQLIKKKLGQNGKLEDAALGRLTSIFNDVAAKSMTENMDEYKHSILILEACNKIIEFAKIIRNDYSHQRDTNKFSPSKMTEDAYYLINLSRAYISNVCKYLIP